MMERLMHWFSYQADQPLIFTQTAFWFFFAAVMLGYAVIYPRKGLRNAYLFFISLFFYYKTSGLFVLLLIFSTVTDYQIGWQMIRSNSQLSRKLWLALSIFINLAVLVYFKYAYFFTDAYNALMHTDHEVYNLLAHWSNGAFGTSFRAEKIFLPVGISFFTFQTMSYAIDIYRGDVQPVKNVLDFGFYVSFFPQLVAGPIVRASEFIPQLYLPYTVTRQQFGVALFWILNGLLKKMLLADYLAVNFIDRVFANPGSFSGFENLAALFGYSLQVYADFSGYTDIAIGVAALLGFTLPVNFNSPYKADSVADFWKRWHISLSTWLRDYLYIPMGGNRHGSLFSYIMIGFVALFLFLIRPGLHTVALLLIPALGLVLAHRFIPGVRRHIDTNINLMLTMTIGGLWHGASLNMIIWGAINGAGLIVYKYWNRISPWRTRRPALIRAGAILLTLTFITFTRTWFRGESLEKVQIMLSRIAFHFDASLIPRVVTGYSTVFAFLAGGYLIHWLPASWKDTLRDRFSRAHLSVQAVVIVIAIILIYQVMSADLQPFIYFVF
ncbi:MAG: MBOAT family protein [Lewinellaceae bacterium]|nr:MBOAT family protein [Saprospiraceae bacterium]MCB9313820.1 MBOAT family protein [Lewinellaceae bacterium]